MTTVATKRQQPVRSTIRARLDRLRWSPFHTRLVLALGTAWILDGLEITIASSLTGLRNRILVFSVRLSPRALVTKIAAHQAKKLGRSHGVIVVQAPERHRRPSLLLATEEPAPHPARPGTRAGSRGAG